MTPGIPDLGPRPVRILSANAPKQGVIHSPKGSRGCIWPLDILEQLGREHTATNRNGRRPGTGTTMTAQDPLFPIDPKIFADIMKPVTEAVRQLTGYQGMINQLERQLQESIAPAVSTARGLEINLNKIELPQAARIQTSELLNSPIPESLRNTYRNTTKLVQDALEHNSFIPTIKVDPDIILAATLNIAQVSQDTPPAPRFTDDIDQACASMFPDFEAKRFQHGMNIFESMFSSKLLLVVFGYTTLAWVVISDGTMPLEVLLLNIALQFLDPKWVVSIIAGQRSEDR